MARVDISRSAFYKYKDFVSPFQDMSRGHLVTFNLELLDRQGVLSSVLAIFAENGANILTINQSIPTSGVAPVTITAATENMQTTMELFMAALKSAEGVIRAIDGTDVRVDAPSICVHGDSPGSVAMAAETKRMLQDAGITIAPFA